MELGQHTVSVTVPFNQDGVELLRDFTIALEARMKGVARALDAVGGSPVMENTATNVSAVPVKTRKKKEPKPAPAVETIEPEDISASEDDFLGEDEAEVEAAPKAKKGATAKAPKPPKAVTLKEVTEAFKDYVERLKGEREPALKILRSFKVKSVKDISPSDFPKVLDAIEAAVLDL